MEYLPLSALQHLLFCERQCALIHLEGLWAENRLTIEGQRLHRNAHNPKGGPRRRENLRTSRGLELVSHRLGLTGKADVVEFPNAQGVSYRSNATAGASLNSREPVDSPPAVDREPSPPPLPIEYKRGKPKKHDADLVQLCAQALCLEEMLAPDRSPGWIAAGAIFYGQTRRRLDVTFDARLREKTEQAVNRLHAMIKSRITPLAKREKKCDRCSLLHLCLPDALRPRKTPLNYLREATKELLASE